MSATTLTAVAGWDLPLLRGAVSTLVAVADRLPAWRARAEAVGRGLGDTDCWYGPAAQAAAAALVQVSGVATSVTAALGESLTRAQQLLAAADTAQDLAEQALAAAAAVPVRLDDTGRLTGPLPVDPVTGTDEGSVAAARRAEALGIDAVEAGRRAVLAATDATDALAGLGIGGALSPATFEDLAWLVTVETSAVPAPPPPAGGGPSAAAAWWAGLSTAARVSAIHGHPERIGALEGLPTWARDRANRLLLGRVLALPAARGHEVAVSVAAEIADREAAGHEVQLLQFDAAGQMVALGTGDLDTADSVVLTVPGMLNSPDDDLDELADSGDVLVEAARAAAPGLAVASMAWFGYRPPMGPGALGTTRSLEGGRALDSALDGLAAARAGDPARVVVSAHSYGTTVVDAAADAPGGLAADAVVLNGSPGMDNDAEGLEVAEVYEASSPADPITWSDWHGEYPTWDDSFGAVELPTGAFMYHWEYYDDFFPTAAAIGEIVAGTR
ncbi:alpha/beta hydrolase [Geodermatophilus sp. SYSU D00697]